MTASPLEGHAALMHLALSRPLTIEDLPEDDHGQTWLIDGNLFATPLGDARHQLLATDLAIALHPLAPEGLRSVAGINVIRGDGTIVIPDVAVINPTALVRDGLGVSPEGLELAIEITSPSTRRLDLTIKRDLFREWGVPLLIVDRRRTPHDYVVHGQWPSWADGILG